MCRRSDRLAKINMGFKDKAAAVAANISQSENHNSNKDASSSKKKSEVAINLGPKFDAIVINKNAPPPPELPIRTLQAIGTGPCKMAHKDLSSNVLNYDNSDE